MLKCNFCVKSDNNGKCEFSLQTVREYFCDKAIERMTKAIGKQETFKELNSNGRMTKAIGRMTKAIGRMTKATGKQETFKELNSNGRHEV